MSGPQPIPSPTRTASRFAAAFFLSMAAAAALADAGHDHGDEAPVVAGSASPRLSAHSDLFELVGIVDKDRMTVYLDRYATNEPVVGARVEFEAGANKGIAQPQPDGTYLIKLDALAKPGELPFSFTVSAGPDTDLLAGDLDLKDPHEEHPEEAPSWTPWVAGVVGVLAAIALAVGLRRRNSRTGAMRLEV